MVQILVAMIGEVVVWVLTSLRKTLFKVLMVLGRQLLFIGCNILIITAIDILIIRTNTVGNSIVLSKFRF